MQTCVFKTFSTRSSYCQTPINACYIVILIADSSWSLKKPWPDFLNLQLVISILCMKNRNKHVVFFVLFTCRYCQHEPYICVDMNSSNIALNVQWIKMRLTYKEIAFFFLKFWVMAILCQLWNLCSM